MFYVYILKCIDGSLYCGYTTDVKKDLINTKAAREPNIQGRTRRLKLCMLKNLPINPLPLKESGK